MLKENPMVALVGPYHNEQTKAVSLITSALGIPNITPTASGQITSIIQMTIVIEYVSGL